MRSAGVLSDAVGSPHDARVHGGTDASTPFERPAGEVRTFDVDLASLRELRAFLTDVGRRAGLSEERVDDLVLVGDEIAANSIQHGGGGGRMRAWSDGGSVHLELEDTGHITDPAAGRRRPEPDLPGGRGLWIVNQLCDEVRIHSEPGRTVVRLELAI
jgi:anti-sigma regulatory factor (Ser/Thr protein kinase)